MAKKAKAQGKGAPQGVSVNQKDGETRKHTLCVPVRVPRLDSKGAWVMGGKSLAFDVLCFPAGSDASMIKPKGKPNAADVSKWGVKLDGATLTPQEARELSIGMGYVRDVDGLAYMVYSFEGDGRTDGDLVDAIDSDLKKEIITRAKRANVIRKLNTACEKIAAAVKVQGLADIFTPDEKAALFNPPAGLLNEFKVRLFAMPQAKEAKSKVVYVQL